MEFFERAHIVKGNESKNRKTTENVKKQLKLMLHGYKVNDNKLIQSSATVKNEFDDSTSVSGFSDLNLSHDDTTNENTENIKNEDSLSDLSEALSSNVLSIDDSHILNDGATTDSISESNKNIESLSEDFDENEDVSSLDESATSIVSGMLESVPESEKSDLFDADGTLAAKILENLKLTQKTIQKQKHKRKYNELENDNLCQQKRSLVKNQHDINQEQVSSAGESIFSNNQFESTADSDTDPLSPPFVSITANDMPHQRLDDIVGEYKHSTIRNLPSDSQNAVLTNNSGIFIEETMSVDIQTEDDVCSLIPEVDDIPTAEEIDKELVNFDTTAEVVDESLINLDSTLQSELISESEPSIDGDMVNVEETFKLYYVRNGCVVTMKHPSELYLQGRFTIRRLGGTVQIFGYTLKDDTCSVNAPYYNCAQSVQTVENCKDYYYYGLFGKLTAAGLSVAETENIVTNIGSQDAVIILNPLNDSKMNFVNNHFKITNLFVKPLKNIEPYFIKASDILNCSIFSIRPWKHLVVNPSWKEADEYAQNKPCRGIVCGGKGSGKSTYLQYQVNKLLANGPVLVVDLDPGQCEFTVAGSISATVVTNPLFGPSFTHLKQPEIMLNIGIINVMDNIKRYFSAVQSLIAQCSNNETLANMPWIINTMGMTNALGLKFITLIIILTKPTFLLQYESKNSKRRFETFLRPHNVKLLYEENRNDYLFAHTSCPNDLDYSFVLAQERDRSINNKFSLRPKDERYLNLLAYFSQLINNENTVYGVVPYEVHLKDLYIGTNVIVKKDCITKVINGKVVALCQHARQYDSTKVFTLSDKALLCHGHGLIRGIDWDKEVLYVITPVPSNILGSVDCLVYADWVPELVGQESQLPKGIIVPYRTMTQDQHKQLMSTPRRRFNPLQLLKMARSS